MTTRTGGSMDFEKMKREEDEAVELMYGKPTDVVEEDLEAVASTFTPEELQGDNEEDIPLNPVEPKETPKQRTSWKKRFTTYKASTDNTIRELRTENAGLKVDIAESGDKLSELFSKVATLEQSIAGSVDPYKDIFTDEDTELIGSEAVDIIKKAMKAKETNSNPQVERLQAELEAIKADKTKQLKRDKENLKAESLESLKVKLSKIVPDWQEIDYEPEFKTFIEGYDNVSGYPRSKLFSNSVDIGDVSGVARFYKEYIDLKPKSREQVLAEHLTPTGGGASSSEGTEPNKKIYSIAEYSQFMDDVTRGKYKHNRKAAQKQERILDIAWQEGRIR